MKVRKYLFSSSLLLLAACGSIATTTTNGQEPKIIEELPDSVVAVAASYQNLDTVRLLPDGCYWYSHAGPVETTLLPLRTNAGNPICVRAPAPHKTPAATS